MTRPAAEPAQRPGRPAGNVGGLASEEPTGHECSPRPGIGRFQGNAGNTVAAMVVYDGDLGAIGAPATAGEQAGSRVDILRPKRRARPPTNSETSDSAEAGDVEGQVGALYGAGPKHLTGFEDAGQVVFEQCHSGLRTRRGKDSPTDEANVEPVKGCGNGSNVTGIEEAVVVGTR